MSGNLTLGLCHFVGVLLGEHETHYYSDTQGWDNTEGSEKGSGIGLGDVEWNFVLLGFGVHER